MLREICFGKEWLPEFTILQVEIHQSWIVIWINIGPYVIRSNDTTYTLELACSVIQSDIHPESS
jgi:hypothetical protein